MTSGSRWALIFGVVMMLLWGLSATGIHSAVFPAETFTSCGPHGLECQLTPSAMASLLPGGIVFVWMVVSGMKEYTAKPAVADGGEE